MQMLSVTIDGFVDTMTYIRNDEYGKDLDEEEWDMMIGMLKAGLLDPSVGPLGVIRDFEENAVVVKEDLYEELYPKYSSIMTWEEFVENECIWSGDGCALLRMN